MQHQMILQRANINHQKCPDSCSKTAKLEYILAWQASCHAASCAVACPVLLLQWVSILNGGPSKSAEGKGLLYILRCCWGPQLLLALLLGAPAMLDAESSMKGAASQRDNKPCLFNLTRGMHAFEFKYVHCHSNQELHAHHACMHPALPGTGFKWFCAVYLGHKCNACMHLWHLHRHALPQGEWYVSENLFDRPSRKKRPTLRRNIF